MEELGIRESAAAIESTQKSSGKCRRSVRKGNQCRGEGTDISDYSPGEDEETADRDDETDLEEEPIPLAIEVGQFQNLEGFQIPSKHPILRSMTTYLQWFEFIHMIKTFAFSPLQAPVRTGRRKVCAKKKSGAMAPGGRQSKRVRSQPPTEDLIAAASSSRILKRLQPSEPRLDPVQEELPAPTENISGDNNVNNSHPSPVRDWSYPDDYHADDARPADTHRDDGNDHSQDEAGQNTHSRQPESTTQGWIVEHVPCSHS